MMDNDFIMRQIKSIADGFGFMIGKKGSAKAEVVFEQQQNQKGKLYTDLDYLLMHHKYEESIHYVYSQKFNLDPDSYLKLSQWLLKKLQVADGVDSRMIQEFDQNVRKYE